MGNWVKVKYFLLGILVAAGLLLMIAAGGTEGEIGRYQISGWAAARGFGVFVVDTKTGVTKGVYSTETLTAVHNNLGVPFENMRNR